MLIHYVEAMQMALMTLWGWATSSAGIALLTFVVGVALVGAAMVLRRDEAWGRIELWQRGARWSLGWVGVLIVATLGWFGLGAVYHVSQIDERWREGAVAVTDPLPSGAPISQVGPALAALGERTYTRTLKLPPEFLKQVGEDGLGVLAPYVTDPTADNVLRLRDKFRRSGREVVFTREATVSSEEPLSFSDANVHVAFVPQGGRVYDSAFEALYRWNNPDKVARTIRFTFPLPQVGTLRDLRISVDGKPVAQAEDSQSYEWQEEMKPGEFHTATVAYRAVGARAWNYNLGSQRRRVQQFGLVTTGLSDPRFARGGLLPTTRRGAAINWKLDNVVTAQQIALVWPEDFSVRLYLQAVSALPLALLLFVPLVLALGLYGRRVPHPLRLLVALCIFIVALGAATVTTIYAGALVGLIVAPLLGAVAATWILGWRFGAVMVPLALFPATFLSEQHSGLMIVALFVLSVGVAVLTAREKTKPASSFAVD